MKKTFIFSLTIFFLITAGSLFAENKGNRGTLRVLIKGFANNRGNAMIALCHSKECYKEKSKAFKRKRVPVKNKKAEWVIKGLSYGRYSLKIYHDENGNGKLDKNALGIPRESYGFSNNARGMFGPPDYKDVIFLFNKEDMTVSITVK